MCHPKECSWVLPTAPAVLPVFVFWILYPTRSGPRFRTSSGSPPFAILMTFPKCRPRAGSALKICWIRNGPPRHPRKALTLFFPCAWTFDASRPGWSKSIWPWPCARKRNACANRTRLSSRENAKKNSRNRSCCACVSVSCLYRVNSTCFGPRIKTKSGSPPPRTG